MHSGDSEEDGENGGKGLILSCLMGFGDRQTLVIVELILQLKRKSTINKVNSGSSLKFNQLLIIEIEI